jgi:predicted DNA-binding transcriptional regulator AlpA
MSRPSFTINEWCALRKMCRSTFYSLEKQNRAPKTYNVGAVRRISPEADDAWLREREAEAVTEAA